MKKIKRRRCYAGGGELTKAEKMDSFVTGALGGATSLLSNIVDVAKTPDVSNIEDSLDTASNRSFNGSFNDLLSQYNSYSDINTLSYSDVGGVSDGQIGLGALKGAGAGASIGSSVLPGWGTAIGAAVGGVGSLVGGLFGKSKAKKQQERLNAEIDNINAMNQNKMSNAFGNAGLQQSLNQRQQMFAKGGYLGNDFTSPITTFNAGGTHEQNPYQGILQGYDDEGNPNLVEEGEVKWNDYIFSNRLGPDRDTLTNYRLPNKYANDSFAYIAEKLSKETEERPNDPISKNTFENNMIKLQRSQEKIKTNNALKEDLNNFCRGGKLRKLAYGDTLENLDPVNVISTYDLPTAPLEVQYINNPNKYLLPFSLSDMEAINPPIFKWSPNISEYLYNKRQPLSLGTYKLPEVMKNPGYTSNFTYSNAALPEPNLSKGWDNYLKNKRKVSLGEYKLPEVGTLTKDFKYVRPNNDSATITDTTNKPGRLQTLTRYAPILSGGLGVLSDVLGLTNKPDYTYANELKNEIDKINPVTSSPIGDYLPYNPIDINYWYNRALANNRGVNRSLIDNSNGSGAGANANLIANNYNFVNSIGDLGFNGENQNWARLKDVTEFNRGTNQYNSDLDFRTQVANEGIQKDKLGLLTNYYNLMNSIDTYSNQSRNANLSRFIDNLARIGDENFAINQVNSNPALYYGTSIYGDVPYKAQSKNTEPKYGACGGKLRHTRKNTYTLDLI